MFDRPLTMTVEGHVLTLAGSVDEYASTDLRERLAELAAQVSDLVVDLSAVDFLPSSGIGVLVKARTDLRRAGGDLTLVAAEGSTAARTLALTGLPFEDGLGDGLHGLDDGLDDGLSGGASGTPAG